MTETKGGKVRAALGRVGGFVGRHKKLFIFLTVLVVVAIAVFLVLGSMSPGAAATAQAPQTLALEKTNLELIVAGDGTVQSATSRQVATTLTSEITDIYVQEGDYVTVGQMLCRLDTTDVEKDIANTKKDIAKAQSSDKINLDAAQRKLNTAVEQYGIDEAAQNRKVQEAADAIGNARTSAGATAGNAAMETAATDDAAGKTVNEKAALDAAQSALATAQNELANAQATLSLAQAEYESALASGDAALSQQKEDARNAAQDEVDRQPDGKQQLYNDAGQAATDAQNAYDAAYRAAYDSFKAGNAHIYNDAYNSAYNNATVSTLQSAYDTAVESRDTVLRNDNTSIASAREALASQKLVDSAASYKTQLESYEKQLEDSTITAPVTGTIIEMAAEIGLTPSASAGNAASATTGAGASSSLFTIKDEGALEITVAIPEYDAVEVAGGMSVVITSDAVRGEEWKGTVTDISPAATDTNSNFTVTIRVTSAADKLAIGMSAKVNILVDGKADVFAVPYDAVTTDASGQSVVYALEEGMAQSQATGDDTPAMAQGRAIPVQTGMETDYYIEISGEGLSEGMTLLADPEGKNVSIGTGNVMFGMGGGF